MAWYIVQHKVSLPFNSDNNMANARICGMKAILAPIWSNDMTCCIKVIRMAIYIYFIFNGGT